MATRNEVNRFLIEFKKLIDEPGGYIIRDHQKTRDALIQFGWTYKNLTQELRSLTVENYSSGPNLDRHVPISRDSGQVGQYEQQML